MEIISLLKDKKSNKAIEYVHKNAISSRISFNDFKNVVIHSEIDKLPEFYVVKEGNTYIGYVLLIADKKEYIPEPFTFLVCHNGDELPFDKHQQILKFIKLRAEKNNYSKLLWLAENELKQLEEKH